MQSSYNNNQSNSIPKNKIQSGIQYQNEIMNYSNNQLQLKTITILISNNMQESNSIPNNQIHL